jgi:hypothetical protein
MSSDTPGNPRTRDTALARLLAEALKARSNPADRAGSSACPDAEILAAYADHGLAEDEAVRWESHFADCERCQKVIAVLAASGEELTPAEVHKLGTVAAASAARESAVRGTVASWIAIWRRPVLWRWLVPAAGLASAALWFALRQAPQREALTAQQIETRSEAPQSDTAQRAAAASSAKPDETQIAQTNLPAPPAAVPRSQGEATLHDKEKAQTKSVDAARRLSARKQESAQSAPQAPPVSELDRLESREESTKDSRAASAQAADKKSQTDTFDSAAARVAAPAAPSTERPAPAEARAAPQGFGGRITSSANEVKQLAKTAPPVIAFSSPGRTVLWRVGPGGRIEHSADQGQTWQAQTSGVTVDLLAGAAPTEKIAWVVGRAGAILRTEDGEHWQRVPPPVAAIVPSSPAPDWIGVEARDALHATITSRDLRRFVTEDAGRTWAPVE